MTHTSPPRTPSPVPDNTRWTAEKASTFLKRLAAHGKVAPAARSVGMSRQAVYELRARAPEFARLFMLAREGGRQRRQAARRRPKQVHPLLAPERAG